MHNSHTCVNSQMFTRVSSSYMQDFLEKKNRVGMGAEEIWPDLCKLDSDGDGRTNGVELGDPNCLWYFGEPSPANMTIYHPGKVFSTYFFNMVD